MCLSMHGSAPCWEAEIREPVAICLYNERAFYDYDVTARLLGVVIERVSRSHWIGY